MALVAIFALFSMNYAVLFIQNAPFITLSV